MSEQSTQAEALVERLFGDLLGMGTIVGVFIGDRLGLYRALADGGPATSSDLAKRAGVEERYAREWLEHQAADGILDLTAADDDPLTRRFSLSLGHADVLTAEESLHYLAPFARTMVAGALRLPEILGAFRTGGGVPWALYGDDMREGQGDANRPLFLHSLARDYFAQIEDVHGRLSSEGARVADIGCGLGWSSIGIARGYPLANVDGYDLDEPSIERAREHAAEAGIADRVRFHARDAAEAEGSYDLVVAFECLHDMPRPVEVLRTMRQLAGDDGAVVIMDERAAEEFTAPGEEIDRLLYAYSLLVCLPDGLAHEESAGTGTVMRPSTLRRYALDAGFSDLEVLPLEHDFFRFYRLHQ